MTDHPPAATRASPWLTALPLAVMTVSGAAIALSAVGTHGFLVPAERRGIRPWINGPLSGLGFHVTVAGFAAELATMAIAYGVAIILSDRTSERQITVAVAAMYAIFVVAPPLLSTDFVSYIDYARLGVVHHLNPYEFPPSAAPHDVIYHFVHWRHTRSVYGPLWTLASYPLGFLSPAAAVWLLKAVAAIAGLGCVALVARIAARLGHSRRSAAVIFGLNPIVLVWAVGGAHNDVVALFVLLAGVALVGTGHEARGGAALVTAIAIKATAGLALPFALLGATRRRRLLAGALAAAVLSLVVTYLAFPDHGAGLIDALAHEHGLVARESVPREVVSLFGLNLTTGVTRAWTVLLAVVLVVLAVGVRRGGSWLLATGWAFVALIATSTWIAPWYLIWPLPFAAVTRDRRLVAAILILQTYLVVNAFSTFAK